MGRRLLLNIYGEFRVAGFWSVGAMPSTPLSPYGASYNMFCNEAAYYYVV